MTWHSKRQRQHRGYTPAQYESGDIQPTATVPYDSDLVDAAVIRVEDRAVEERLQLSLAKRLADFTKATRLIIGPDTEWGPARRRSGIPSPEEYTNTVRELLNPAESGNAD